LSAVVVRASRPQDGELVLVDVAVSADCTGSSLRRRILSSPAFWPAVTHLRPSGPASHHRRGRSWEAWRAATTPMARRRPAS